MLAGTHIVNELEGGGGGFLVLEGGSRSKLTVKLAILSAMRAPTAMEGSDRAPLIPEFAKATNWIGQISTWYSSMWSIVICRRLFTIFTMSGLGSFSGTYSLKKRYSQMRLCDVLHRSI